VDKIFEAYGGRERLESLRAYRMEGYVEGRMSGSRGGMYRTFSRPDCLKVVLDYPGKPEVRILDGETGWRSDPKGSVQAVEGFLLGSIILQAARANLPWILQEKVEKCTLLVPMHQSRRAPKILEFSLGEGLTVRVLVDPETNLVTRSQGLMDIGGMKTYFETVFSDFREVEGLLFPFHEENHASGFHTGTTTIDRVVINPEIPEGSFCP